MMPTDYVDNQYSSAVQQGTMKQEDVDRIKELYGLAMPDAYLHLTVGDNSKFAGETFTKNTKEVTYDEDISLGIKSYNSWYEGSFDGSKNTRVIIKADTDEDGKYLNTGKFSICKVTSRGAKADEKTGSEETLSLIHI